MSQCQRTVALYKPGQPIAGVHHHFAFTGQMPNTGSLRCTLCGKIYDPATDNRTSEHVSMWSNYRESV